MSEPISRETALLMGEVFYILMDHFDYTNQEMEHQQNQHCLVCTAAIKNLNAFLATRLEDSFTSPERKLPK